MEITVADSESPRAGGEKPSGRARTCVGCGERAPVPDAELVRVILGPEGHIAIDPGDGGFGRGAHVHARPACLARAATAGLPRAAKSRVHLGADAGATPRPLTAESLAAAIAEVYGKRVDALLATAVRARAAHIGTDAVVEACRRGGDGVLVVVACDAAAAADTTEVRRAVAEGRAVAWGTKATLAEATRAGREAGVGVVAIDSTRIASALHAAVRVVEACRGTSAAVGRGAERGKVRKQSRTERGS